MIEMRQVLLSTVTDKLSHTQQPNTTTVTRPRDVSLSNGHWTTDKHQDSHVGHSHSQVSLTTSYIRTLFI